MGSTFQWNQITLYGWRRSDDGKAVSPNLTIRRTTNNLVTPQFFCNTRPYARHISWCTTATHGAGNVSRNMEVLHDESSPYLLLGNVGSCGYRATSAITLGIGALCYTGSKQCSGSTAQGSPQRHIVLDGPTAVMPQRAQPQPHYQISSEAERRTLTVQIHNLSRAYGTLVGAVRFHWSSGRGTLPQMTTQTRLCESVEGVRKTSYRQAPRGL